MQAVIIGNSAAGLAAAKAFRKYDQNSSLIMISKEGEIPYSRVLLPYVLRGKLTRDKLFIREKNYYQQQQIDFVGGEVVSLAVDRRELGLKDGSRIPFDKLLIATGSYAVAPPIPGINQPGIYHMWTKDDLDQLTPLFDTRKKVVILGSGFIALQAAWSAYNRGLAVEVVEIAARIMPNVLDQKGGNLIVEQLAKIGIKLHTSTVTEKIEPNPAGGLWVYLREQEPIACDFMIVGTGVRSNIGFLAESGVITERAVPVDAYMQTNIEGIYAAGDVAAGPTAFGDPHLTHALWPTAVEMGEVAGANMAGAEIAYSGSLNMNVTQMFNLTVASMGIFNDDQIDDSYVFDMADVQGYLKVCYKNGLIVGLCLVGGSESVALFGKLRPIIRKKIPVECIPQKLEDYLTVRLFKK
ncbi:MAG: FAD-dependent oxidoreductase [Clostridiales bacterium]